jgi:hypothetical protein
MHQGRQGYEWRGSCHYRVSCLATPSVPRVVIAFAIVLLVIHESLLRSSLRVLVNALTAGVFGWVAPERVR